MLLFLVLVEKTAIYLDEVRLDLLVRDILQTQWLDRIRKETAGTLEYRIRISLQVDELSVREHLQQCLHTPRMRWVLAQILRTVRIPEGNLDEFEECFLKHFPLVFADIVEKQITVAIFEHMLREEPEIIICIRHHVRQSKLLFLGKIHCQFHIIRRTFIRHQPTHILFEERLSPHHQMRKYSLISSVIPKMLVTREHIMYKCSSTPPVSQNEHRIMLQWLISQQLLVTPVL